MYYDKLSDLGIKLTRRGGQEKTKCPQCHDGRKNKTDRSLSVNITEGTYNCHNCGWTGRVSNLDRKREKKYYEKPPADVLKSIEIKEKTAAWFKARGISEETLEKFLIFNREEWMPQTEKKENCICFPYIRDGEVVNIKFRDAKKNFKMVSKAELIFYNLSKIGDKKYCIITEGEIDCMSIYESGLGIDPEYEEIEIDGKIEKKITNENLSKWCAVSVPNGASKGSQKMEYLDNCADWFMGFHEIVIATDADAAGLELKDELIRRLGVERCRTISYPIEEAVPLANGLKRRCKDLNEVLQHLGPDVVRRVIETSESIPVDGIYYLSDVYETMIENFRNGIQMGHLTHFGEMDDYFRWKTGDVTLMTGYGNHGKTFCMLQLMLQKSIVDDWRWGIFSPENYPPCDFFDDLIEMYVGKHLQDMNEEEYNEACLFIDNHIFFVYPEDEHDLNSIHEKFRHLILKKGLNGVLLDPWNQLDHMQKGFEREDQYLSRSFKDIKRFALLNAICYNIIAHPKSPTYNADRSLPPVDSYDLAGGAMWANKMCNILSYYRPNFHIDKNDPHVKIFIQKIKRKRTGGKLGSFDTKLQWSSKRYCDPVTEIPYVDPKWTNKMKVTTQQRIWDGDSEDAPF